MFDGEIGGHTTLVFVQNAAVLVMTRNVALR